VSVTACLWANTLNHPQAGGNRWIYINWALGLRACGLDVAWLESVSATLSAENLQAFVASLRDQLKPYGLSDSIALCPSGDEPVPKQLVKDCLSIDNVAATCDVLIDLAYADNHQVVQRFRRSALIDIDPGLTQLWVQSGGMKLAPHDLYFTIGETVGVAEARLPDCGLKWIYVPPCVALEWWPVTEAPVNSPLTTVTNWWGEWMSESDLSYDNSKRAGFQPCLSLPKLSTFEFELALGPTDESERKSLERYGWSVRDAWEVASTPWDYQSYVQSSRGEFSCAKPSCGRLQTAWISDRTLCYLASGRPAVVEHTGKSRFLPDAEGLFRFKALGGALAALRELESNYNRHGLAARALAEEFFDAKKSASRLLEYLL
jgi:hypothetical protein